MSQQTADKQRLSHCMAARVPATALIVATAGLLCGASLEFYNIAWGTGRWIGEFSLKWALALGLFVVFCLVCLLGVGFAVWPAPGWAEFSARLANLRGRVRWVRWPLLAIAVIAPIWLLQYSPWGVVIDQAGLRMLTWALSVTVGGLLITRDANRAWTWSGLLSALLITGAAFVIAAALTDVTSYPFSLNWSEGNRLWDYSLMFGKRLYAYSPGDTPVAYLDFGRQLLGGLPFLLPGVSILGERLWVALVGTLPYLVLGLLAFWPLQPSSGRSWILAGVWGLLFLSQGPIHAPLVLCAILVAIAWRQANWLAGPLVALSGYFAEISRFTWMFAPAIWAAMLELGGSVLVDGRIPNRNWRRALIIGLAGLVGSAFGIATGLGSSGTSLGTTTAASTKQPLLWYRLLPNATYGNGILLGLLIAAGPVAVLLICMGAKHWKLNRLQRLAVTLPLVAFLFVGLTVSTKIGGGGDLHNLDMFLIGLLFVAALEWRAFADEFVHHVGQPTVLLGMAFVLSAALPGYQALMTLRPLSFASDTGWLAVLTHVERPRDLGSLPPADTTSAALREVRAAIQDAQPRGQILFMDQRQLLTFGYLGKISLVAGYEKKRMMDEALSANISYFQPFYQDLAAQRFSLIITSPLRTPIKDSEYGFGEENNAWVYWIARPVLCYYEEKDMLTEVKVELLVPRTDATQCGASLPKQKP
jgi:hypothetical protein